MMLVSPKDDTHTPHSRGEAVNATEQLLACAAFVFGERSGKLAPGRVPRPVRYLGIVGRVYARGV
eukprot:2736097-Amphidinium_carterae.2